MEYRIKIMQDADNEGKYAVALTAQLGTSADKDRIIAVVMRGLTWKTAEMVRSATTSAFEHGMNEQRARFAEFTQKENKNKVTW